MRKTKNKTKRKIGKLEKARGITLIALVITIIVLLILAGVTIATLTGENGILTRANDAKRETEEAATQEELDLALLEDVITQSTGGSYLKSKGVNAPDLLTGMTKIMFKLPDDSGKGEVIKEGEEGFDENNWYDYNSSKWANAMTEDGSMWVWIPRFAYTLNGTNQTIDTSSGYYVHPAFTNESSIDYVNGGWDEELTGIWVAKFEAGYTDVSNKDKQKPVFQPIAYSMNYITINDSYNVSRNLTNSGNIYGLSSATTDSHLMKNSEWGAVAYLAYSIYGGNTEEPYVNNINVNNNISTVYAVTGLTTGSTSEGPYTTTAEYLINVKARAGNDAVNGIYAWDQEEGQKASSTLNMYGIYDLSGGLWERTAGYIVSGQQKDVLKPPKILMFLSYISF